MPGRTKPPGHPVTVVPAPAPRPAVASPPPDLADLPPKHAAFIGQYLMDPNAAKAYREVYGCSAAVAETNGPRLLRSAQVQAVLRGAQAERAAEAKSDAAMVLRELERIGFVDLIDIFTQTARTVKGTYPEEDRLEPGPLQLKPIAEWPEDARRAIASIKVKHYEAKEDRDGNVIEEPYDVTEIKFWDKPSVLKLIGTHHGMRFDRRELTGGNGDPLHPPAGPTQVFIIAGQEVHFQ